MRRIKKGDEVIVLTGKDKGQRGTVSRVLFEKDRVFVDGINMVKKHTKANPNAGVAGGIIDKEMSIHLSNVAIYNSETGKGDRVGFKLDDGKKVRYFKSNGANIDV
ncbi:MAG: 50S ribosomal protein L24 [Thiotrichales bacterium]|jgi:large subunit ribosomal protein L24|nr:50S ribosomal protein L24 [Thiotrichales bacterium]MBT3613745.1 50S ribosomal protein L24 [Thiotrichales bacterium]MBT3752468.1 50S ribosomal protein L24 [Thiotrichales bacterium]MBT3838104.1 50S ribosomal protein L24 [Thiotrichales bacterium]MBT4152637.1 50S ribosomal protein L24 [Thiotrichales bacterium]